MYALKINLYAFRFIQTFIQLIFIETSCIRSLSAKRREKREQERLRKKKKINIYRRLYLEQMITLLHLGNGYSDVSVKNVVKRIRPTANVNAAK